MLLKSKDIVDRVKRDQTELVSLLLSESNIIPRLAIVVTTDNQVIDTYVRMKKQYGADIGVNVDIYRVEQSEASNVIDRLNLDDSVNGIIVQLPLDNPNMTEEIVGRVLPEKDVDALGSQNVFEPATPNAILMMLSENNIVLEDKKVLLVGRGKLVGAPLEKMLRRAGVEVDVATKEVRDLRSECLKADVIISATGQAHLIKNDMVKADAVVIDAGVASENGKTVGDVSSELYERDDVWVSPNKGGVGPLTVCALFVNLIDAARPN